MRFYLYLALPCLLVIFGCLLPSAATAQGDISYEPAFPNLSFAFPVEIQHAGDGSDRLFVVEQSGRIKVFANAAETASAETFLDLTDVVSFSSGQEIGLLGLAFHPRFAANGYFYVYHTQRSNVSGISVALTLARYRVSASNPNRADPDSRLEIFRFDKNQNNSNHNGGKIAFGPDGYLYASLGDGGGGGDPKGNAQNLNTVFGSILRIDIDTDGSNPAAPNGNYEIPADNPRVGRSGLDELYAWGIRNTWKFSFDGSNLWGGDVGQGEFEEINLIKNGGNYGWNRFEANSTYRSSVQLATTPDTKPVFAYDHDNGDKSITLGYVYRGRLSNPAVQGKLIYADYISGRVWSMAYNENTGGASSQLLFRTSGTPVSSFGLDEAGELYFSGYGSSAELYRIIDEDDTPPTPTTIAGVGSWQILQRGIAGVVEDVAVDGDKVYAAGDFSSAGDITANNIAVYTAGQGWQSLSSGANGKISALALGADGRLYAGGSFTTIGGASARNIAVWDGSSWQALGTGTNGPVLSLGTHGSGDLYAGGAFSSAGGKTVNNIARWDGSWSALTDTGTGVAGTNNEVRSIAFDGSGLLYIGGNFASAGDRTANRIATFDGSRWGTLGAGTSGFVQAITITDDYVYAGGNFAIAGGQTVNRLARWDRTAGQWQRIGQGVSGNVNALLYQDDYLYVGGNFETVTTTDNEAYLVNNIARWSESDGWEALGTGTQVGTGNQVNALQPASSGSGLYAGGSFGEAGATSANRVALWRETDCSLIPYVNVNRQGWKKALSVSIDAGDEVWFGPQSSVYGTASAGWSWAGPNDFTATGRELRLRNVGADRAGTYTVTNVDPAGCRASLAYTIELPDDDLLIPDGAVYELQPQHRKNLRLDAKGEGTTNGTAVQGFPRTGQTNQQWRFISRGDNVYEIEPVHAPGKRLDVARVSTVSDTEVLLWSRNGQANQRWRALPVGNDGLFRFAPLHAPDNRLDIKRVGGNDECLSSVLDSGNSQRWRLIPVSPANVTTATRPASAGTGDVELSEVLVYPNPVSDQLTIESKVDYHLRVYDATGRQVLGGRYLVGVQRVEMGQLTTGLYLVRLEAGEGVRTVRVVVE